MSGKDEPTRRPAEVWHHAVVWALLAAVPAVKSLHVIADDPPISDGLRQAAIAATCLVATAAVIGLSPRRRLAIAVGAWPDVEPPDIGHTRRRRWVLAIGGAAAGTAAASSAADGWYRWPLAAAAVGLLVALVVAEIIRFQVWRVMALRVAGAAHPLPLWTTGILTVSAATTAFVLAGLDRSSALDGSKLAELGLVTAFGEELIFRGCLLALASRVLPARLAHVAAALSFGFWHFGDGWVASAGDTGGSRAVQVAATVLVTLAAGLVLTFIRQRGRTLLAPTLAHMASNLPGIAI